MGSDRLTQLRKIPLFRLVIGVLAGWGTTGAMIVYALTVLPFDERPRTTLRGTVTDVSNPDVAEATVLDFHLQGYEPRFRVQTPLPGRLPTVTVDSITVAGTDLLTLAASRALGQEQPRGASLHDSRLRGSVAVPQLAHGATHPAGTGPQGIAGNLNRNLPTRLERQAGFRDSRVKSRSASKSRADT
jgi:hypothetical protein